MTLIDKNAIIYIDINNRRCTINARGEQNMIIKLWQWFWQKQADYWWDRSVQNGLNDHDFHKYIACIDHKFHRRAEYTKKELLFSK